MKPSNIISILVILLLSCNRPTVRMNDYTVHGIDVSHYQSSIDWDKVSNQNIHFAFVKATEGVTYIDTLFCHNWEEMSRVGLMRGAYHFFRPKVSAELQADNFSNIVKMKYGDLPPVLDVEVMDGVSQKELVNSVRTWLTIIEERSNIRPIIYTNQSFFNKYLAGHFDGYPIWIARYNSVFKPYLHNEQDWTFWQYGNKGQIDGIDGDVDFNVFNGSLLDIEDMCYGTRMAVSSL